MDRKGNLRTRSPHYPPYGRLAKSMPIPRSLYRSLTKQHGSEKARGVYYAMEKEGKAAFRKAVRTAQRSGRVLGLRKRKS